MGKNDQLLSDEVLRENIKNNLIALRKKHGLTQVDIAIMIDKAAPTVASWEQGKSLPDLQTLYRLSVFYKKTMEYFYEHDVKGGD